MKKCPNQKKISKTYCENRTFSFVYIFMLQAPKVVWIIYARARGHIFFFLAVASEPSEKRKSFKMT